MSDDSRAAALRAADSLGACAAAWAVAKRARVGEWEIRYRDAGHGVPVVLVHGLGVSADYWWRNGPPLGAAGLRALAPDLPGFGRTEGPAEGLSVVEQAAALAAWCEALELPPAVFVGHSLSSQTILQLAADRPDRVAGMVLAGPTGERHAHRLRRQALALLVDIPRESYRLAVEVAHAYLLAGPRRIWHTWNMGARHDPLPLLPRVRARGIVVLGTRDPVVPHDFARALAEGIDGGEIVWIEGAAHAVIFTHADEFNRVIVEFVEGLAIGS